TAHPTQRRRHQLCGPAVARRPAVEQLLQQPRRQNEHLSGVGEVAGELVLLCALERFPTSICASTGRPNVSATARHVILPACMLMARASGLNLAAPSKMPC